jgi:hypothetical protein
MSTDESTRPDADASSTPGADATPGAGSTPGAEPIKPPATEARAGAGGRFHSVGVPTEKSKDFQGTASRLSDRMRTERAGVMVVMGLGLVCGETCYTRFL